MILERSGARYFAVEQCNVAPKPASPNAGAVRRSLSISKILKDGSRELSIHPIHVNAHSIANTFVALRVPKITIATRRARELAVSSVRTTNARNRALPLVFHAWKHASGTVRTIPVLSLVVQ